MAQFLGLLARHHRLVAVEGRYPSLIVSWVESGHVQRRRGSSAATRQEEAGKEQDENGCMHRGISSVVPKGQSVGEMHTRLKEPDRRGNAGRRHRYYRIRSASAQYHVGALSGGLQQYEQAVAAYSRQITDLTKRVAKYEKRPDSKLRGLYVCNNRITPRRIIA